MANIYQFPTVCLDCVCFGPGELRYVEASITFLTLCLRKLNEAQEAKCLALVRKTRMWGGSIWSSQAITLPPGIIHSWMKQPSVVRSVPSPNL